MLFLFGSCLSLWTCVVYLQHNSILGSVFADFYDQQLPSIQTSTLSQQVSHSAETARLFRKRAAQTNVLIEKLRVFELYHLSKR